MREKVIIAVKSVLKEEHVEQWNTEFQICVVFLVGYILWSCEYKYF